MPDKSVPIFALDDKDSAFRREEIQIKRDDLKCKREEVRDKRWAIIVGLVGAALAAYASIATSAHSSAAAERAARLKWKQELLDDQRRSLQTDIQTYARTLSTGINLIYRATADHQIPRRAFSRKESIQWEREYRAQILAQNDAALAVHLDDATVSRRFVELQLQWAALGEEVSTILAAGKGAPRTKWQELQRRLLEIDLPSYIDPVRHLVARPQVKLDGDDK